MSDLFADGNEPEFLQQKKSPVGVSAGNAEKKRLLELVAQQKTQKAINALKIMSPIMVSLMRSPGVNAPDEALLQSFEKFILDLSQLSTRLAEKMNLNPKKESFMWFRNEVETCLVLLVRSQWGKEGEVENAAKLIEAVVDLYEKNAPDLPAEDEKERDCYLHPEVCVMQSFTHVLNQYLNNFSLYRNIESDMEKIMGRIFEKSVYATERLGDNYASPKQRSQLFGQLANEAGRIYAASWAAEVGYVKSVLENQPQAKRGELITKYQQKGGFPLDRVEKEFDRYFDKMLAISEKLVLSTKSSAEKELVKNF